MLGLSFKGIHNSSFQVGVRSIDRNVRPAMRRREMTIDGRHGTYDFGGDTFEKRHISVEFSVPRYLFSDLRETIRKLSAWLNGSGRLVFDDEPDKYYLAKVYQNVSLEQIGASGVFTVIFDCQPFADSMAIRTHTTIIQTSPQSEDFETMGTYQTPITLTIKNEGGNTVRGFILENEYRLE